MNEGMEILGDSATGGLMARAVESEHGEAGRHAAHPRRCLNCGADLTGNFCQHCGQKAHLHRSIGDFWHDFLHGVLHFDGKFWRTLPMLIWRPGDLTRRYIHGERARFISPLAIFLFAVFLTFAAFHNLGSGATTGPRTKEASGWINFDVSAEHAKILKKVQQLELEIQTASAAGQPTQKLTSQLGEAIDDLTAMEVLQPDLAKTRRPLKKSDLQEASEKVYSDIPAIQHAIEKVKKNPELLLYKLQSYAYKYAWALIPISAAWLWLLFPFSRRFHFYDHIVFVTYSIAFMMLTAVAMLVLMAIGVPQQWLFTGFILFAPVHIYRQLSGAYRGGRFATLLRTIAVIIGCFITLSCFMLILLALGGS